MRDCHVVGPGTVAYCCGTGTCGISGIGGSVACGGGTVEG